MTKLIVILLSAVFINNYVLSRFLGICPFLGVSKKLDSATGIRVPKAALYTDEDGTYSDEAKAAAKARAEEILAEWKAGDQTEESFAALAEAYSEDDGSNSDGGLYDAVAKGMMVEEFDAFCFDGHKPGDTAIVYGESASYAGYHVMYYVGEGELYSDHIARSELSSEAMTEWLDAQLEGYEPVRGFWYKLVG